MATLVDVIFLGTGTSGCVPNINCLTDPRKQCRVCLSSVTPEGKRNKRRNTSLLVRFRSHGDAPGARLRTVLIDCGKTFYESALEWFPHYGIHQLDGVILTHGHADACFGLDDLRPWTLNPSIGSNIDIYLASETMETVQTTFPYLVNSSLATGGGDVALFNYHIFDRHSSFTIHGLEFTPLPVHHGIYFTTNEPYWCYGLQFAGISYISDTNHIPDDTMERMNGKTRLLVLDCLRDSKSHPSHFGLEDALKVARKLKPARTYLVGFAHKTDHYEIREKLGLLENSENLSASPAWDGLRLALDTAMITEDSGDRKQVNVCN
ncbi:hypothetical protein EC973_006942 [Apophysomyces ossiformis]|uniref:Metallo-beta-lactamase domain-containing protein n=1 Tax=Apophysomyces ossiformis TaxID=679940 RepID=A0A8H7BQA6_9FUNG|nr:hypothetical protein EC973_006942 [Apophysomyces ossiformis]